MLASLQQLLMIVSLLTFTQTQKKLRIIGLSPLLEKSREKILNYNCQVRFVIMVANTQYTDYFMILLVLPIYIIVVSMDEEFSFIRK
jgi:POT family proton-dependent oligopeptide transporter